MIAALIILLVLAILGLVGFLASMEFKRRLVRYELVTNKSNVYAVQRVIDSFWIGDVEFGPYKKIIEGPTYDKALMQVRWSQLTQKDWTKVT